ncbi:MAG: hypothetical protein EBT66_01655 [Bacteroidetes bacterium]|nr:hypothetical protein [Bacteroidota bacterium]
MVKKIFPILLGMFWLSTPVVQAQSFLNQGKWVQLEIAKSGMYKMTKSELQAMGFDLANSDPRNFCIYGIQGQGLPSINGASIRSESPQIACEIIGESDGVWNDGDAVIFYGQSAKDWEFDRVEYRHSNNFYASKVNLLIGHGTSPGKRVLPQKTALGAVNTTFKGIQSYWFHDSDIVNPAAMGRQWFGERLGNETLQRSFVKNIPSTNADTLEISFQVASFITDDTGSLVVVANGVANRFSLRAVGGSYEPYYLMNGKMKVVTTGSNLSLQFKLNRPNTKSYVMIDYFEVKKWEGNNSSGKTMHREVWRYGTSLIH